MYRFDSRPLYVVFWVGWWTTLLAYAVAPGLFVGAVVWLVGPRFGWTVSPLLAAGQVTAAWVAITLGFVGIEATKNFIRDERERRRHREFMALRDLFYARTEICTDSLETLRARAADRTGSTTTADGTVNRS